jgi:hypothetical protein
MACSLTFITNLQGMQRASTTSLVQKGAYQFGCVLVRIVEEKNQKWPLNKRRRIIVVL